MRDGSVGGLAAENIAGVFDFDVDVLAASLPLKGMAELISRYESVQFVSDKNGCLFMIGWRADATYEAYSLVRTSEPVRL